MLGSSILTLIENDKARFSVNVRSMISMTMAKVILVSRSVSCWLKARFCRYQKKMR